MSEERISVPRKATDRMGNAAYSAAGCPSDWFGFDEMWDAAIRAWEDECADASHEPARDRLPEPLTDDGEVVLW